MGQVGGWLAGARSHASVSSGAVVWESIRPSPCVCAGVLTVGDVVISSTSTQTSKCPVCRGTVSAWLALAPCLLMPDQPYHCHDQAHQHSTTSWS